MSAVKLAQPNQGGQVPRMRKLWVLVVLLAGCATSDPCANVVCGTHGECRPDSVGESHCVNLTTTTPSDAGARQDAGATTVDGGSVAVVDAGRVEPVDAGTIGRVDAGLTFSGVTLKYFYNLVATQQNGGGCYSNPPCSITRVMTPAVARMVVARYPDCTVTISGGDFEISCRCTEDLRFPACCFPAPIDADFGTCAWTPR